MRIKITKPCVIEVLPGSIVEVSDKQIRFLKADYFETEDARETPETSKKRTTRKAK